MSDQKVVRMQMEIDEGPSVSKLIGKISDMQQMVNDTFDGNVSDYIGTDLTAAIGQLQGMMTAMQNMPTYLHESMHTLSTEVDSMMNSLKGLKNNSGVADLQAMSNQAVVLSSSIRSQVENIQTLRKAM